MVKIDRRRMELERLRERLIRELRVGRKERKRGKSVRKKNKTGLGMEFDSRELLMAWMVL